MRFYRGSVGSTEQRAIDTKGKTLMKDIYIVLVQQLSIGVNEREEIEHKDLAMAFAASRVDQLGIGASAKVYCDDLALVAEYEHTKAGVFRTQ